MTPDNAILEFVFVGLTVVGLYLMTVASIAFFVWFIPWIFGETK